MRRPYNRAGNSRKGNLIEIRFQNFLDAQGYLTTRATQTVVWIPDPRNPGRRIPISRHADFFGCIDIIGIHTSRREVLVQVTTADARSARRRKVAAGLEKILRPASRMKSTDILVASWGNWPKRGFGFVVDRLDGCGTDGTPVWEEAWNPFAPSGFIASKQAPIRPRGKDPEGGG